MVKKLNNKELTELEEKVIDKILTLIMSAFGFVSALAWNDAIQTTIATFIGKQSELWAKYIYAVVLTTLVVVVSIQLDRTLKQIRGEDKKTKKANKLI